MAKKTKKEKIIAEYRRKMSAVSASPVPSHLANESRNHSIETARPSATFAYVKPTENTAQKTIISIEPSEFLAIKKDLLQTLLITVCIIIGQIALWKMWR